MLSPPRNIYGWLTNPILDPDGAKRVTMGNITKLVITTLRRVYNQGATDVDAVTLQEVAELMIVRRDEITGIDTDAPDQLPPEEGVG